MKKKGRIPESVQAVVKFPKFVEKYKHEEQTRAMPKCAPKPPLAPGEMRNK